MTSWSYDNFIHNGAAPNEKVVFHLYLHHVAALILLAIFDIFFIQKSHDVIYF